MSVLQDIARVEPAWWGADPSLIWPEVWQYPQPQHSPAALSCDFSVLRDGFPCCPRKVRKMLSGTDTCWSCFAQGLPWGIGQGVNQRPGLHRGFGSRSNPAELCGRGIFCPYSVSLDALQSMDTSWAHWLYRKLFLSVLSCKAAQDRTFGSVCVTPHVQESQSQL